MPRGKNKKSKQTELLDVERASQTSSPSSVMEDDDDTHTQLGAGQSETGDFGLILKELREFRKDSSQQLNAIREEINKSNTRIEEED